MTTLDSYAAFLTARWGEIEQVAIVAATATAPLWDTIGTRTVPVQAAAHMAIHDPTAVLADIAAKRAILYIASGWEMASDRNSGLTDIASVVERSQAIAGETVLRHLAEPFRDHPDHPENRGSEDE